jgi:uncharacterized delta-60 repeat protein
MFAFIGLLLLLGLWRASISLAALGDLDSTFGSGGKVVTSFPGGLDTANEVAVQSDGKIVVAGSSGSDFALARYNTNGTLDASFGTGGRVNTDFPTGMGGAGTSLVIQPDGKIVVAGSATDPASTFSSGFAMVRYNTNGSLDTSFDGDGRVVTSFAGSNASAEDIALQPDGKLVLAGSSTDNTTFNSVFALARYNTDGSLDNSFDTDGRVTTDIPGLTFERANAVAVQTNGRIVAAGQGRSAFKLTRYNTDGGLDTGAAGDSTPGDAFGTSGIVTTQFGGTFEEATALAIQSDGKIIAVGQTAKSVAAEDNFALARYNAADGSLDTTFDTDGMVTTDFGLVDGAADIVIQPDGRIVVAGRAGTIALGSFFALARYNANGSLDNNFDGDGKVLTDFSGGRFGLGAQGVALQTDGRIVAAGDANISGQRDFGVARYNADGSLDVTGFGILGKVLTDFPLNEETITGMVVQPDGKIVAAGRFNFQVRITGTQDLNFQLARYNTDGTLDPTFGSGGLVSTDFEENSDDLANGIALQSDGRIVVVGQSGPHLSQFSGPLDTTFAVARYNTNGSLDTTFDGDGRVTTNFSSSSHDTAIAVALQANGKIVVAGNNGIDFALVRYNTDGSLDTNSDADPGVAFDTDGRLTTDFNGGFDSATAVVIQSDGKIVAGGSAIVPGTSNDFALARYNTDGSLDSSGFGTGGKATTDFFTGSDGLSGLVIQPNGKLVGAGSATITGSNTDFALARYNTNGTLDTNSDADPAISFDGDGKQTTDFGGFDSAADLALYPDGKIVAAGFYFPLGSTSRPAAFFALAQYNTDGSLDSGFGTGGRVTTDFFGINNQATAVVIQADNKVVAGGFADTGSSNDFALVRYQAVAPPDVSISVSPSSAAEDGATNLVYTFSRTGSTTAPLTVNFSVGGTAIFGTDYSQSGAATFSSSTGTVTFGVGNSTATVTVDPTVDSTVEPDETVILTLTSGTGYNVGSPNSATGTITNDDTAVSVAVSPLSVAEDGPTNLVYTFSRAGNISTPLTVNFSVSGTATFNTDYSQSGAATFTSSSGTVSFGAGNSAAVTVDPTADGTVEPDETVILNVTSGTGYTIASPSAATGTITNDDGTPSLSINDVSVTEGNSGTINAVFTVTLSAPSSLIVTVNFATADGTATQPSDYQSIVGLLTFNPGEVSKTITVVVNGDITNEPNETFFVNLSTSLNANIGDNQGVGTILNDDTPQFNFSLGNYTVSESGGSVQITVNRSGDPSPPVTVDYLTTDNSNPADFVLCSSSDPGTASSRCDFNTALGTLRFAANETSKTFNVLITQDSYVEGIESLQLFLSNPTGGATLGTLSISTLQIVDDVPETSTNPILDARNFVRQHYHDFLNREPDQPGWDFWTDNIAKCNDPARRPAGQTLQQCLDRQMETTSGAFFLSPEFQYTGFYIYCVYKGSLGRMPNFLELMRDVQQVSRGIVIANAISGATIEQNRAQYETEFIQRPEFLGIYGTLSSQAYVDRLFLTTGASVSSADKQALVNGLTSGTETRATVLHKVVNGTRVISEGQVNVIAAYGKTFTDSQFNPAFVQMEYLGYLRRNSDTAGFTFWLDKMNSFGGDFLKAEMVRSFLMSPEYRQRFAAP